MVVTFYGAVREVTGSMHLVTAGGQRILLDCGLFQGRRREAAEKNRVLPFDPALIGAVVLSHAHADHSGRLPLLVRGGYAGPVFCTPPTKSACDYLLPDAASIQQSDADYLNYKTLRTALLHAGRHVPGGLPPPEAAAVKRMLKRNGHELNVERIRALLAELRLEAVEPLFTLADAENALAAFTPHPYREPFAVGGEVRCTFFEAGHILGSAIAVISARENGALRRIGFTGDLGRFGKPVYNDPELVFPEEERNLDLLILESTYGDRLHESVPDLKGRLAQVAAETFARGGTLLIPAFAFGRTQVLLYVLHELFEEGRLPRVPVYVDSPLAVRLTRVFGAHLEACDEEAHNDFIARGKNPFRFESLRLVESVAESMALNREDRPQIVIAASGMCEAGRILHHLRFKIHNPKHTILIVGFMAKNTLGRRIEELGGEYERAGRRGPEPVVRFLNKDYPLRARVVKLDGFSGHADREEIRRFLQEANLRIRRIALVHGEEEQTLALERTLRADGYAVAVPRQGETLRV